MISQDNQESEIEKVHIMINQLMGLFHVELFIYLILLLTFKKQLIEQSLQ